jgi:hypothetical protein
MCNHYATTNNQSAIAALFRVINRYVGNLAPMPGVFPDYPAPVVRNAGAEREPVPMRWGMPPPPRTGGPPVTNIRNTSSPHWRGWLKSENRCVVPFNSFAEISASIPSLQTSDRQGLLESRHKSVARSGSQTHCRQAASGSSAPGQWGAGPYKRTWCDRRPRSPFDPNSDIAGSALSHK